MNLIKVNLIPCMKQKEMSLEELATKTNMAEKTLISFAANKGKSPTLEEIDKLCTALECDFSDILKNVQWEEFDETTFYREIGISPMDSEQYVYEILAYSEVCLDEEGDEEPSPIVIYCEMAGYTPEEAVLDAFEFLEEPFNTFDNEQEALSYIEKTVGHKGSNQEYLHTSDILENGINNNGIVSFVDLTKKIPLSILLGLGEILSSTDFSVRYFNNPNHPKFFRRRRELERDVRRGWNQANDISYERVCRLLDIDENEHILR